MSGAGLYSLNSYAFRLGLCGIGLAKARRGEGRGDVKGEAVKDLALVKAGGAMPKPGGGAGLTPVIVGEAKGVPARGICQGAGEDRRMTVCRRGGGEVEGAVESRKRHRAFSIASSRSAPVNEVSLRKSSSNFSVLSSSSNVLSCKTGRHKSYTVSDTIL